MAKFDKEKDRALSKRAQMGSIFHGVTRSGVAVVDGIPMGKGAKATEAAYKPYTRPRGKK